MTAAIARDDGFSLRLPLVVSVGLHLLASAALLVVPRQQRVPMAPTYRVNLVAAPPGPRQIGAVSEAPHG